MKPAFGKNLLESTTSIGLEEILEESAKLLKTTGLERCRTTNNRLKDAGQQLRVQGSSCRSCRTNFPVACSANSRMQERPATDDYCSYNSNHCGASGNPCPEKIFFQRVVLAEQPFSFGFDTMWKLGRRNREKASSLIFLFSDNYYRWCIYTQKFKYIRKFINTQ